MKYAIRKSKGQWFILDVSTGRTICQCATEGAAKAVLCNLGGSKGNQIGMGLDSIVPSKKVNEKEELELS